jgi:hypothetical protein
VAIIKKVKTDLDLEKEAAALAASERSNQPRKSKKADKPMTAEEQERASNYFMGKGWRKTGAAV